MSTFRRSRARRVLYERRIDDSNRIDIQNLFYNPYKKCYQRKTTFPVSHSTTQIQYNSTSDNDDRWIGDIMLHKPKNACTRFWLQNARGLPSTFDGNLFRYDLTNIRDNFIHYYALPEARINTSNSDITNHLSQIHQNVFGSGALTITNTPGYPKKFAY